MFHSHFDSMGGRIAGGAAAVVGGEVGDQRPPEKAPAMGAPSRVPDSSPATWSTAYGPTFDAYRAMPAGSFAAGSGDRASSARSSPGRASIAFRPSGRMSSGVFMSDFSR